MSPLETDFQVNLDALRARITKACQDSGRDIADIELLPVSKRQSIEAIRTAQAHGFVRFGENYVQEGSSKALALPDAEFVLHGPLQRNKAKAALQHFQEIMSIDRLELAQRLNLLAEELGLVRPAWVQVDLWGESTKMGGCMPEELPPLLEMLRQSPRLPLQGFMAIPPPGLASAFRQLSELREAWQQRIGKKLRLSMGMSDDLEEAIHQGSNQLRIGSALFGDRSISQ